MTHGPKAMESAIREVGARLDRRNGPHLYRQIAALVREQIQAGILKPGDSLPTQRELGGWWGIGEVTVRRALQELADDGLLQARPGTGTVVCDPRGGRQPSGPPRDSLAIGVAFADLADGYPFFRPMLAGLRQGPREVAIRLFDMPPNESSAGSVAHAPPLSDLDGLIILSPVNLGLLALSQRQRLPTVLLFSDLVDGFSRCILPEYTPGVIEAVGHVARQGRRRVALVSAGADRFSTGRWVEAYRSALSAFGLPSDPRWVVHAGYSERDGAEATRQLLSLDQRPDAVLYASDYMARGGLLAAHEASLRVPDDLSIIGAGPVLEEGGWTVPLTSIDLCLNQMGRMALEAIEAGVDGGPGAALRQSLTSTLRHGQTA